jgi:hypothetical protein
MEEFTNQSLKKKSQMAVRFSGINLAIEQQEAQIYNELTNVIFNNFKLRYFDFFDLDPAIWMISIIDRVRREFPYFRSSYFVVNESKWADDFMEETLCDLSEQVAKCTHPQFILFIDYSQPSVERQFLRMRDSLIKIGSSCAIKIVFIARVSSVRLQEGDRLDQIETALTELLVDKYNIRQILLPDMVRINPLQIINGFRDKFNVFDFRYLFYSKSCRYVDWLSAISERPPACKQSWQLKHKPGSTDWHNALLAINNSKHQKFVCVLDNAKISKRFLNQQYWFMTTFLRHRQFLSPNVKFLKIVRPDSEDDSTDEINK